MLLPVEILLPVICSVTSAPRTSMCSCIPPKSARSQVQVFMGSADVVFAGTVTEIRWKVAPLDSTRLDSRMMFRLAVMVPSKTWKGAVPDTVIVWTPDDAGVCGFDFEEGQPYLVFATRRDSLSVSSGLCTGTQTLAGARAYLKVLGRGARVGRSESGDRRP